MAAIDIGRVCRKTQGREKGELCVIIDLVDRNYVVVAGINVKRRRVNMDHITPLDSLINIQRNATDEEVVGALRSLMRDT
jgi:large subunit ribosomal protein L14e